MIGCDPAQFLIRRLRAHAAKERAHLELPFLQVRTKQRRLLVVGELDRTKRLGAPADTQPSFTAGAKVLDPLRVTARRNQILRALVAQQVDRRLTPLAGLAAFDLEHAGSVHADANARQPGNEPVEDVGRKPARSLVMLHQLTACLTSATIRFSLAAVSSFS